MKEIIPILLGVMLALACERVQRRGPRRATWLAGSVVAGVTVTVATGEWLVSPAFVLVDVPLVAVGALLTRHLVLRAARRPDAPGLLAPYRRPVPG